MKVLSAVLLLFSLLCSAQTFQGRVINGTTGNPQPSCKVVLFTASGEQGRALTNDSGEFRIAPKMKLGRGSAVILQVTQAGVDYFQPVIQGQFANVKVYQSAKQVNVISSPLSILQFQTENKRLQVTELHALNNDSNPPITQVDSSNFVLSIPHGAQIEPAIISSPDGASSKVPLVKVAASTDLYSIDFPIEPGLTKYAIRYELPYEAPEFVFRRLTQYPMDHVGVIVPKSMRFRSLSPRTFHTVAGSQGSQEQQFEVVKLASNTAMTFSLSGTGELAHSFRPLQPGERPVTMQIAPQVGAVSPPAMSQSRTLASANPAPIPRRSPLAGNERTMALGILLFAAALTLLLVLRARLVYRDRTYVSSTDVDLSYPHEAAERGRREVRGRHR
jgi:hypothetical protein